uniref:Uncharacterized protein n=1 Tax=Panagrolaimus sp. PS1159 TaxID=55785 RepID=A0AC35GE32_9BILA
TYAASINNGSKAAANQKMVVTITGSTTLDLTFNRKTNSANIAYMDKVIHGLPNTTACLKRRTSKNDNGFLKVVYTLNGSCYDSQGLAQYLAANGLSCSIKITSTVPQN